MYKEFSVKLDLDNITPRDIIKALSQIPEEYQDSFIHIDAEEFPDEMTIDMVIDDHEEAMKKWRQGNPDYTLFMDLIKKRENKNV